MKLNWFGIGLIMSALPAVAEINMNYDDPAAILASLEEAVSTCGEMDANGEVRDEIFGIKMIRLGGTCAIVNGDELDDRVRVFLEEQNLPWAGVGVWVNAPDTSE
ncbi:hypothetical protein [Litoreibacter halocynthiae]|uniref:hypothetical protein n=1 Tax=Litoreibacter halocynthiae TaxID=1242689 RepID=UPI002491410C|nr:hypothetical protein [Litoreibacter halocynthiae]